MHRANSADQAFAGFQQGQSAGLAFAPQLPLNSVNNHGSAGEFGPDRLGGGPGPTVRALAPGAVPVPRGSFIRPLAPATPQAAAARTHDWVDQFSGIDLTGNKNARMTAATQPSAFLGDHMVNGTLSPAAGETVLGRPMPSYPMQPFDLHREHERSMQQQGGSALANPLTQQESALDVEAFNRAFGDYDEAAFNDELAKWAEAEAADKEFEAAQNDWMAMHGPNGAIEQMEAADRALNEAKAALMAEDDTGTAADTFRAEEEERARSGDRRRAEEELARAAISILNSVAENQSEKFKKSNFFELMRRIGNREVVVDGAGTNLVDATTGETIVSRDADGAAGVGEA